MVKPEEITERRSIEQNSLMWARLTDVARQVQWPVDGEMVLMSPDDWKHVFSSALRRHTRITRGIDGGFVVLGQYTSKFTKQEMGEMLTIIEAFAAERGVKFSDPTSPPA